MRSNKSFAAIFAPESEEHSGSGDNREPLINNRPSSESDATEGAMRQSVSTSVLDMAAGELHDWRQKPLTYKIGSSTVRFQKPLLAAFGVIVGAVLVLFYVAASNGNKGTSSRGFDFSEFSASSAAYNATYPLSTPTMTPDGMRYRIAAISDLDTDSKLDPQKESWSSFLMEGYLTFDDETRKISIDWDGPETEIKSALANGGRGMELSELVAFNGKLYTVDDRTGVVYQVENGKVYPWVILADGNGQETKGFKSEWCAVKDGHLYVGGLGKEWTTPDGTVINFNPMFVKRISPSGAVEHLDWHDRYLSLRAAAGISLPGYMIHESAAFSHSRREWMFLPRRASKSKYNDVEDERRGTNLMLEADEEFKQPVRLTEVGELDRPTHGFSSFKFVPGSDDEVVVALKSEEFEGNVHSYLMAFDRKGNVLYPEVKIADRKYEGIEFV